ncbi:MAG: hypothetical protein JNG84_12360 [Archangium sp.]|nr:hypothetical protein [Archangium sp.]
MHFRWLIAAAGVAVVAGCDCRSAITVGEFPDAGLVDAGVDAGTGIPIVDAGIEEEGCGLVTCTSANADCGLLGDGCGAVLNCGDCIPPQSCGGGGTPSRCGGNQACVPRTCAGAGADCGPFSDGCGGLLNCGTCALPETCGGGGLGNRCGIPGTAAGDGGACTPRTCASAGADCGALGDGCGAIVTCGTCDGGTSCGGGGIPNVCGGGNTCIPGTCPPGACGILGDGCGSTILCPGSCVAPATCGGGGAANECGGGNACVPATIVSLFPDGGACGFVGDGCGDVIDAGTTVCQAPSTCGGGGLTNQCGGAVPCVPKSCGDLGANCGPLGDGCGNLLNCGPCTDGGTCGGNGVPNVCGTRPTCVPKTCAELQKNCGQVGDGCGGLTPNCGTCDGDAGDICGGGGNPSVCGSTIIDAGPACTNLCLSQTCPSTRFTGTVLAPTDSTAGYGTPDPIPGALVYVPNGTVRAFDAGVSCDRCSDGVSGSPLVSTTSAVDGTFSLSNVPCNVDGGVPLVIQLGRWRRQITVPSPACCSTTALTAAQTRLPRRQAEGHPNDNIPLIAVVTGDADTIENVLPKVGIAREIAGNYTLPDAGGRVRFYRDDGFEFGGSPPASSLFNNLNELRTYDMVIFDCIGSEALKTPTARANVEAYANAGGRVFSSHFGYVWLFGSATSGPPSNTRVTSPISFTSTAVWNADQSDPGGQDAYIDLSFEKGRTFAQWVQLVNAQDNSSLPWQPRIRVNTVRHDFDSTVPPAQQWVYRNAGACTAATCAQIGYSCGNNHPNGCGGTLNCRNPNSGDGCPNAPTCGGGATPGACGTGGGCVPFTCAQRGFTCGRWDNGCGGTIDCGFCDAGICGGGGTAGQCGTSAPSFPLQYTFNTPVSAPAAQQCGRVLFSDFHVNSGGGGNFLTTAAAPMTAQEKVFEYLIFDLSSCITPDVPPGQTCTPRSCAEQGLNCGAAADGCGNTFASCGTCTDGGVCGAGGIPGLCTGACIPRSCAQQGFNCGPQSDGCGNQLNCGTCTGSNTCGGGGSPGVCGGGTCVPKTCMDLGFVCGTHGDGCGGVVSCGTCTAPQTCGGGGVVGLCGGGAMCVTQSCGKLNFNCGQQTDGCGGTQNCGSCIPPLTCGGGGLPGVCGGGGMCTPRTCAQQNFNCGQQGDGCGGSIDCGMCPAGQICGAAGPGLCGTLGCQPLTCMQQGLACGPAGDGCGNVIQCGACPAGETCGGGGTPGACGKPSCTPRTCSQVGANCGAIADGCGGAIDCGTCSGSNTCGGGGLPNVCGGIN